MSGASFRVYGKDQILRELKSNSRHPDTRSSPAFTVCQSLSKSFRYQSPRKRPLPQTLRLVQAKTLDRHSMPLTSDSLFEIMTPQAFVTRKCIAPDPVTTASPAIFVSMNISMGYPVTPNAGRLGRAVDWDIERIDVYVQSIMHRDLSAWAGSH
jgi:hypothetical protein